MEVEEDDSREESEVEADSDHEDESESQLSQWLGELENYAKVVYHVLPNKHTCSNMGLDARKPIFRASVKASFKPVSSVTETS